VPVEASLGCSIGEIVDLSAGGMYLVTTRPPAGAIVVFRLGDENGGLQSEGRVVWFRRRGWRKYEIALEFPPFDDRDKATLTRLCTAHRRRIDMAERSLA
jgi:hypothetical protein